MGKISLIAAIGSLAVLFPVNAHAALLEQVGNAQADIPPVSAPVESEVRGITPSAALPAPQWGVLFYLNGSYGAVNSVENMLSEVTNANNSNANVQTFVEIGYNDGGQKKYARYHGTGAGHMETAAIPDTDMGNYESVVDFVKWAKARMNAKRITLVMVGHGGAMFEVPRPVDKLMQPDSVTKDYISLPQMRKMLEEMGGVDILVLNSCIMASAEVLYQTRGMANAVVDSEENMMMTNIDAAQMLNTMSSQPSITEDALGDVITKGYVDRYVRLAGSQATASVSAMTVRPDKMDELAADTKAWSELVMATSSDPLVMQGVKDALNTTVRISTDTATPEHALGDMNYFINMFADSIINAQKAGHTCTNFHDLIMDSAAVVKLLATHGPLQTSNYFFNQAKQTNLDSITILVPQDNMANWVNTSYQTFPFAQDSGWGKFATWLLTVK